MGMLLGVNPRDNHCDRSALPDRTNQGGRQDIKT
jgi:hypothetical protein